MKTVFRSVCIFALFVAAISVCSCSLGNEISVSQTQADTNTTTSSVAETASPTGSVSGSETTVTTTTTAKKTGKKEKKDSGLLSSTDDIGLTETGEGSYTFTYSGESYNAYYTTDNWKIVDSYKITNKNDMIIICKALSDIHPIHTNDYEGYRTPEDLAYEWEQHNTAYSVLPDSSKWKANAKDVDLDPKDQGKSFLQMARDRLSK